MRGAIVVRPSRALPRTAAVSNPGSEADMTMTPALNSLTDTSASEFVKQGPFEIPRSAAVVGLIPRRDTTDRRWRVHKAFIVSLIAVRSAVLAAAPDVSGVWSLRLTTSEGESAPRVSVTLKQDGDRLTGRCVIGDTNEEFTVTGRVTDGAVTWRCASKGPVEASFSGTINSTGREMTGSWTTPAPARGTFKGSKSR